MGLLGLLHLGILFVNVARTTPTQGYDWPGHLTYLHYVARHWRAPSAAVTPQFFNPPLYYFCVAALHRLVGGANFQPAIGWRNLDLADADGL
jgi:hypothetical protein